VGVDELVFLAVCVFLIGPWLFVGVALTVGAVQFHRMLPGERAALRDLMARMPGDCEWSQYISRGEPW